MYSTSGTPEARHGRKKTVCGICGKDFESDETLITHKRMEHSESSHAPAGVA
ncbi:MAG: hypothetical protein WA461_10425 [Nitrososphaeraceae archaeon]